MDVLDKLNNNQFKTKHNLINHIGAINKSIPAVCNFNAENAQDGCVNGTARLFREIRSNRNIVCKHWLLGLCKKGDQCEFLHMYNVTKIPECYFDSTFNYCHNKECPFLHIDPRSKVKQCRWYKLGSCRNGSYCLYQHLQRVPCKNYLAGFCPNGPNCTRMHPRIKVPPRPDVNNEQK